jgi:glycoside/pentoside/hexuronide:cation symporter, GPH family
MILIMGNRGLDFKTKLGFGIGDLGGNLFFTISGFYLLFYLTDTVKLNSVLAGSALMIGKFWDALTDPAVGYLSDITRTRWGRRRPWMFVGSFLLLGFMLLMFNAPDFSDQTELFIWAALCYCLLCTAYTFVNVPYGALTPELTSDYHERSVLNGYRMSFAVVGTFLGAGLVLPLVSAFGGGRPGWLLMAAVMGAVMLAVGLATVFSIREPDRVDSDTEVRKGFRNVLASYAEVLTQKPFLLVLLPWALHITGVTVIQSALVYYFQYVYGDKAAFQIALVILLACAIVFIPVWIFVSKFIGKKNAYNLGMGIFAATVVVFFFIGERGVALAYVLMAVAGVGFAAQYAMPFAMLPDVVEYDYAENGRRREGVYYGLWTFVSKVGQSLAILASGWILQLSGYVPDAVQGDSAKLGIRLLAGIIPALFFTAGIAVLSFYPISRAVYEEIKKKAEARRALSFADGSSGSQPDGGKKQAGR